VAQVGDPGRRARHRGGSAGAPCGAAAAPLRVHRLGVIGIERPRGCAERARAPPASAALVSARRLCVYSSSLPLAKRALPLTCQAPGHLVFHYPELTASCFSFSILSSCATSATPIRIASGCQLVQPPAAAASNGDPSSSQLHHHWRAVSGRIRNGGP